MKSLKIIFLLMLMLNAGVSHGQPAGLDSAANRVILNGEDWSPLSRMLAKGDGRMTIVHFGDSHVKPGFITDAMRQTLQDECGDRVVTHCIGYNGATFATFLQISGFARQLKRLAPQLIIVSLGTNEAYGNCRTMTANMARLLSEISAECPDAKLLLTTPMETHRHGTSRPQPGVAAVRDIILAYGRDNGIPVWNFYAAAGGSGAAQRWLNARLMSRDHLHLLKDGYTLQGNLLGRALLNALLTDEEQPLKVDSIN